MASLDEQRVPLGGDLVAYARVLRRRAWLILLAILVVVGPALLWSSRRTPLYRASAEMLLAPKRSETLFDFGGSGVDPARAIATELKILQSSEVRDSVARTLGYRPKIEAEASPGDNVVKVRAISSDPEGAAEAANTAVSVYIEWRRAAIVKDTLVTQGELQKKIDEKQRALDELDARLAAAGPQEQPTLAQAQTFERAALVNQQNVFRQQLDQLQVNASLNAGGAQLITPAVAPTSPFEPAPVRTAGLAVAVGLFLGVALVFLVELIDDSIKSRDDLERVTPGLPVLACIPAAGRSAASGVRQLAVREPASPAAEAHRVLRTAVQFLGTSRGVRVLQVTSPGVSEGKTETVANLAVSLARAGARVTAVCSDLRRPRLHRFLDVPNDIGLTSVILGEAPLSAALRHVEGEERLRVLASGPLPPDPSELLSSQRFSDVLDALRADADMVLVDSPPALPVSDAAAVATRVDGIIIAASARTARRKDLASTLEVLRQVGGIVLGTVLTSAGGQRPYDYRPDRAVDPPPKTATGVTGRRGGRAPSPGSSVSSRGGSGSPAHGEHSAGEPTEEEMPPGGSPAGARSERR